MGLTGSIVIERRPAPARRGRSLAGSMALLAMVLLFGAPVHADERILDYTVEAAILADAGLEVTEHITVRAEGRQIRRGIFRDLPTGRRDRSGDTANAAVEVLAVERDGQPEPWFVEDIPGGVRINTGGDDSLPALPADFRFTLRYRIEGQLGFLQGHDELYWNAIGIGWAFAIDAGQVRVRLPEPVPADQLSIEGFTGPRGSRGRAFEVDTSVPGEVGWRLTGPLAPGHGLTILLGFPKAIVTPPTVPSPSPSRVRPVDPSS